MSTTHHISFEELADNLVEVLKQVREEHTTLVVEYASGEKLVIQSLPPPKQKPRRSRKAKKTEQEAGRVQPPLPSARLDARADQIDHPLQHLPSSVLDGDEVSSTGAIYDLDPQSLTPG